MPPRYLLRFDDICATMARKNWEPLEELLLEHGVKPILAVIPDNQDPKLTECPPDPGFWDRVRRWQALGWGICLHGYQHRYVNSDPGILGLGNKSEFSGLSFDEQFDKLSLGLEIFRREGVRADGWVAPSHTFDWNTVEALGRLGIHTISDGIALAPFTGPHDSRWVPQQFANMRSMPFGVWTFCYHYWGMSPQDLEDFRRGITRLHRGCISLQEAAALATRPLTGADRALGLVRRAASWAKGRG